MSVRAGASGQPQSVSSVRKLLTARILRACSAGVSGRPVAVLMVCGSELIQVSMWAQRSNLSGVRVASMLVTKVANATRRVVRPETVEGLQVTALRSR